MRKLVLYVVAIVAVTVVSATVTACGGGSAATAGNASPAAAAVVTTLAGKAGATGSTDGSGAAVRFNYPVDVACDAAGNLYVTDHLNLTIRKVTPAGVVTTFAGKAGSVGTANGRDGAARFASPVGITRDAAGNLYVTEFDEYTIRKITPAGMVTTLAGKSGAAGSTDGLGGAARFDGASGIVCDAAGNLYVSDSKNDTIRKITPAGQVATIAGAAGMMGSADGSGAAARFNGPEGVACDAAGDLYVVDSNNCAIRKITPAGVVTTVAGKAGSVGSADGTAATASFYSPSGIACDKAGDLYVVDNGSDTIRKITLGH